MGEFCQNRTKLCTWRFFFLLGQDNAHALSCLNYKRKMRHLVETNHLTVTCKSITKGPAWVSIHLCLWYYSTYKHIFAEIKKFSWLNYGGFLKGKNQLKIHVSDFRTSDAEPNLCTEDLSYSNQRQQDQGQSLYFFLLLVSKIPTYSSVFTSFFSPIYSLYNFIILILCLGRVWASEINICISLCVCK